MRTCEGLGVKGTPGISEEIWRFHRESGACSWGEIENHSAGSRAPSCQNKDRIFHSAWGAVQLHRRCWWAAMPLGSHWVPALPQILKLRSKEMGGGWHLGVGVALGGSQTGSEEAMTLSSTGSSLVPSSQMSSGEGRTILEHL